MESAANYQSSGMARGASLAGAIKEVGQYASLAAAPASPVQSQLIRQRELLSELEGVANGLIDPLRTALSHDPREPKPAPLQGGTEPVPAPGCDLEEALMNANSQISSAIYRLRDIRGAIRL